MANWETRIFCVQDSISQDNVSTITVHFDIRCLDKDMIGSSNSGKAFYAIRCDDQHSGDVNCTFDWLRTPAGMWWRVASRTFKVPHNADGTKKVFLRGFFSTGELVPAYFVAESTVELNAVQTSAGIGNVNFVREYESIEVSYETKNVCDLAQYNIGNGWVDCPCNKFKITGLQPSKSYTLRMKARTRDSKLWEESLSYNVATKRLPTIKSVDDFIIEDVFSVYLDIEDMGQAQTEVRFCLQESTTNSWRTLSIEYITGSHIAFATYEHKDLIYSQMKTSNTANFKIQISVKTPNREYLSEKIIVGTIKEADPVFQDFAFVNTHAESNAMFGNTSNFVTLFGNLRATIANKAVPKKGASIDHYDIALNNTILKSVKETTSPINIEFSPFGKSGTYTLSIKAVDSRGNKSAIVNKAISVYDYHNPAATIGIERFNGFESKTSLNATLFLSKVLVTGANKNSLMSMQYRFKDVNTTVWSGYKPLSFTSSSIVEDNIEIKYSTDNFENLDVSKSYDFEFKVRDKIQEITFVTDVDRGIPIAMITDNGKLLVGELPDEAALNDPNKLVVGGDITAKDGAGNRVDIVKTLQNLIITSETEPVDQVVNGIWFKVVQ